MNRVIRRSPAKPTKAEPSGKKKWVVIGGLILLIAASAYAFFPSGDPAVARLESLGAEMDGADDARRRELRDQMRQEYEKLSPESQEQMRDQWRERAEIRESQKLYEFFAKTPQEQIAELDADIKRDEQRRKEWEKRRAERGNQANQQRGGPGGGRGNRTANSSSDPNARRKSYLDKTSAQSRAMRSEKSRMRDERRRQLGLTSSGRRW